MSELLEFLRTHDEAFRSRARLASLYSDFRFQRNTNPDGYGANSSAWLRALSSAAKHGLIPGCSGQSSNSRFVLDSGEELLRELNTAESGRPLALGGVLEDAVNSKALLPLRDFLDRKESLYSKSWIPTPWSIVSWGLRQIGLTGGVGAEDKLVQGSFVIVSNVEAAAKAVIDKANKTLTSDAERIFSRDLFEHTFSRALGLDSLSANDLSVLITHLSRDREALSYSASTGVVKFKSPDEAHPSAISQEDKSIASLRSLIASLSPQIDQLTSRIANLDIAARTAVASKQTTQAKTALRQKKATDTKLQERTATLAQLEDVYMKIEEAADQVQIVKVLEASGQTLKSLNAQTGGVDKVSEVMESLQESMLDTEEIGNAINDASTGEIDEGEVEDELLALEKVEREGREAEEKADREGAEAKEKEDREKKEAQEAEVTRKRLAELRTQSDGELEKETSGEQHTDVKTTVERRELEKPLT